MKVFIVGITGATGIRVARLLGNNGDVVYGLYRRPAQTDTLKEVGATGTIGDITTISVQALANAARGMNAIVYTAGSGETDSDFAADAVDRDGVIKAIEAAKLAEVSRFLLVSVFPEAGRAKHMSKEFEHYISAKKSADVELVHSGLDWIVLRPSALTNEPGTGRVSLSPAEIHTHISRDDVASTIVALLDSNVRRRILEVTSGNVTIERAVSDLLEMA